MSRGVVRWLVAAALAGLVLRLVALPLPGTLDVSLWRIWTFAAATDSPARVYGADTDPPERRALRFHGRYATVDYPPLAVYVLGAVGRAYHALYPAFPGGRPLTVAVKLPGLVADLGMAWLLFAIGRRLAGPRAGIGAALAYWLNPAMLLESSVLGYLDAWFAWPALGAVAVAAQGRPGLAGLLLAAAALTKAQGIFVAPVVALAVWQRRGAGGLATAGAAGAAATALVLAPVAVEGALPHLGISLASLARHDMLSGNAANLWWVVTWIFRAGYEVADRGWWGALTFPVRVLALSTIEELGWPGPKPLATLLAACAMGWGGWRLRRRHDIAGLAALSAFLVHAYYMLAAQVHENHLFLAVPFMIVASVTERPYRALTWATSAVFALNLNLFYGLGEGVGYALPRTATAIDATVVVAMLSMGVFAWHVRIVARLPRAGAPACYHR